MHEALHPSNQDELSEDDLAVLRAFDMAEELGLNSPTADTATQTLPPVDPTSQSSTSDIADDMLVLFVTEADEEIAVMRQALRQLEQDDHSTSMMTLQHSAHKLKGTAGAVGYEHISTIARYTETLVDRMRSGALTHLTGLVALTHSVQALEATLYNIASTGRESDTPRAELEQIYNTLNVGIRTDGAVESAGARSVTVPLQLLDFEKKAPTGHLPSGQITRPLGSLPGEQATRSGARLAAVQVDARHLEQLMLHIEQLAAQRTPLEHLQAQVESAQQELFAAQLRLQQLETRLSTFPAASNIASSDDEPPMSSLVARILNESMRRIGHVYRRKSGPRPEATRSQEVQDSWRWDELEIDPHTKDEILIHSLSEAIADVATASARLRTALEQLKRTLQKHLTQTAMVRSDALLLHLAPLSTFLPRLQRAVKMSAEAQGCEVHFEAVGETTEIARDTLEMLAHPLLQLVRTCVADSFGAPESSEHSPYRIWLHAHAADNEATIELGFSTSIHTKVLDTVRESIDHLKGSITAQQNAVGGTSFYLRLPHSRGTVHGLLLGVGSQQVVVPFSQVQYINYENINYEKNMRYDALYVLDELLGFPGEEGSAETVRPVLILQHHGLAVQVSKVLGEVEVVMKPLAAYLQRPGIAGTVLNETGDGSVLLVLDLPTLVMYTDPAQQVLMKETTQRNRRTSPPRRTILIADDSVYIRQSVLQILSHAGYDVMQARDGEEALERLQTNSIDVLLLDIEMPNLNGYDVLNILRANPEFARPKVVMLTSRSSEKHQRHAEALGADGYLTKPCPQETLLATIESLTHI